MREWLKQALARCIPTRRGSAAAACWSCAWNILDTTIVVRFYRVLTALLDRAVPPGTRLAADAVIRPVMSSRSTIAETGRGNLQGCPSPPHIRQALRRSRTRPFTIAVASRESRVRRTGRAGCRAASLLSRRDLRFTGDDSMSWTAVSMATLTGRRALRARAQRADLRRPGCERVNPKLATCVIAISTFLLYFSTKKHHGPRARGFRHGFRRDVNAGAT